MARRRNPFRGVAIGWSVALASAQASGVWAAASTAETPSSGKRDFQIAAGALDAGIQQFSRQANVQVLTAVDLRRRINPKVAGRLEPGRALSALIKGQGLVADPVAGGFVLRPERGAEVVRAAPGAATIEPPAVQADGPIDELVVTSFRESLLDAHDLKRSAVGAEDVILSEDIAAFPDLNLAESLQRIPGVTISRDAGEGRQITLRGLGPDFTRTQLNGMEVLANTASGMDNRGGVSRTRSFDYSLFASELFDKVVVKKSYSADQDEGGIGGTVQLSTAKPFDYPGFKAVMSAKGQINSNTRTLTPRLVGLMSDRWGDFGALVSVAYSVNDSNEFGYRSFNWGQIHVNPANIGPGVSAADAARLTSNDVATQVFAPQADTLSSWFDHRERVGTTVSLQYEPGTRLKLGFDALFSRLANARKDFALAASGTNSLTGPITGTQVITSAVIQGDTLVAADYSGVDLRSEQNAENDRTDFSQTVLRGSYQLSDALKVKGLVGYSRSAYALPVFDKVFLEAPNHSLTVDDRPSLPVNTYGFDTSDPSQWNLMRLDTQENGIVSQYINAKSSLEYALGDHGVLTVGAEYKAFSNAGFQRTDKVFYNSPTDQAIPAGLKATFPYDSIAPYVVGDVDGTYAYIGQTRALDGSFDTPGTDYRVTEDTTAIYAQYAFSGVILEHPVRANAGLRYYSTRLTSAGNLNTGAGLQPVSIVHNYDGVLPAFNLAVEVSPGFTARLSANRDISRPALADLAAAGTLTTAPFGGSISTGNPDLKPFTADSVEGSLEFYQGRVGFFSISIFYKNLASFITTQTSVQPYSATGFPLSFLLPGQDGSVPYNVSRPINGPGADIKGVEIALQRDFDFLPAPFDHLGAVGNVTYADGSSPVIIDGRSMTLPLTDLSKYTANATLYYETERWGARVSEAYRAKYLDGAGGNGNIGSGYKATNNIDFAAHYNLTQKLRLTLEGINLTDQATVQFADAQVQRTTVNTTSGRTFVFGATYAF